MINSVITHTGRYIPTERIPNTDFLNHDFHDAAGNRIEKPKAEIIQKLYEITGIRERRFAHDDLLTSDIATLAAEEALKDVDRESLDGIIVAQNLGDVRPGTGRVDTVPSIAARVKHKLRIKNPYTVAFDLLFGCPGWLQAVIMADCQIKSGAAKRMLIIGAEILSRVSDPHDVDCMIFADGAGATVVEATSEEVGVLSHIARSDAYREGYLLRMGAPYSANSNRDDLFVKMDGHKIYKYAVRIVPAAIKKNLEQAGFDIGDVKKILIHQANEKMDEAIVRALYKLYGIDRVPDGIMPMIISWSGNSSVATLPTLFDLICKGDFEEHRLASGDIVVFASVGAGMNVNSMVYRMP